MTTAATAETGRCGDSLCPFFSLPLPVGTAAFVLSGVKTGFARNELRKRK